MGGMALGKRGEVEGAVAQEQAEEGGAQQGQVAGPAGVAAQFGVFAPGDIAAVMVGAFHRPVAAAAGQPLAGRERGGFGRGDEQAGLDAGHTGFLVRELILDCEDGGGMGKAELARGDVGQGQLAVLGAAVGTVVGEKKGALPCRAWAA